MVPFGVPIVSLLLGGMVLAAMSPFPGPSVWQRCLVVAVSVVLAYTAVLVSVRRVRRSSPAGRAVAVGVALAVPTIVVGLTVVPLVTDITANWLVGPAASLTTAVVFRLAFAVGEAISPKSPVNLVAGVVGALGYLMAIPAIASPVDQIWVGLGLAALTGVLIGGISAWLLAGAQYYVP